MTFLKRALLASVSTMAVQSMTYAQGTTGGTTGGVGTGSGQSATTEIPTIAAPSELNTSSSLNTSNALGRYYANPYYQGRAGAANAGNVTTVIAPGGFGVPLFNSTNSPTGLSGGGGIGGGAGTTGSRSTAGGFGSTTGGARSGTSGGTTGFGGGTTGGTTGFGGGTTAGGFGGTTGGLGTTGRLGGLGQTGGAFGNQNLNSQNQGGVMATRPIAYTAMYKFTTPQRTDLMFQQELRAMLDNSSSIAQSKGMTVSVAQGGLIVLKGTAADEDEARLVENMIRLTPGVRDVKNELKY